MAPFWNSNETLLLSRLVYYQTQIFIRGVGGVQCPGFGTTDIYITATLSML